MYLLADTGACSFSSLGVMVLFVRLLGSLGLVVCISAILEKSGRGSVFRVTFPWESVAITISVTNVVGPGGLRECPRLGGVIPVVQ